MINDSNMGFQPGGRSEAFQAGVRGPGNHGPLALSLMANQSKWNMAAARGRNNVDEIGYKPSSVLTADQVVPSISGYSERDYSRVTPTGVRPSMNGYASDTYDIKNPTQFRTQLTI